ARTDLAQERFDEVASLPGAGYELDAVRRSGHDLQLLVAARRRRIEGLCVAGRLAALVELRCQVEDWYLQPLCRLDGVEAEVCRPGQADDAVHLWPRVRRCDDR